MEWLPGALAGLVAASVALLAAMRAYATAREKLSSLEKEMGKIRDWKESLDRQVGALSEVPGQLAEIRREQEADRNTRHREHIEVIERLSRMEGQRDEKAGPQSSD